MPRVYVFQHIACEHLGTLAPVLSARGLEVTYIRLFEGAALPDDAGSARALIFLGGPMSVNDEPRHAYLRREKQLIREALMRRQPVLGVCLGAQLIASAAGAKVFPGPHLEVGWEPISLTVDGRDDAVMAPLAALAAVFHWHGETFDLPPGATRLAFSALTMNQAFRLGNAYALQFHIEVDAEMIAAWAAAYPRDLGPDPERTRIELRTGSAAGAAPLRAAAAASLAAFLDTTEVASGESSQPSR